MKSTSKNQKSTSMDRFNYINDDKQKLVIPIGPRFQAAVPEWRGPPHKKCPRGGVNESDSSKWLGTVIWSTKNLAPKSEDDVSCNCVARGSIPCVKLHVNEKSAKLRNNLGPAFYKWKFDEMGEAVAKVWKQPEQQKLAHLIKKSALLEGEDFMKHVFTCFPTKSKKEIVNYYFNVYIPRQVSVKTRCGKMLNTDDEEEEKPKSQSSKGSRKRARVDGKIVKKRYLSGRR